MTIDSKKVYSQMEAMLDEVQEQLREGGYRGGWGIVIYCGPKYNGARTVKLHMQLESEGYGSDKAEVEGVALQDMVEEFLRRLGFARRQSTMLLGAPVVEGSALPEEAEAGTVEVELPVAAPKPPGGIDDEIPF